MLSRALLTCAPQHRVSQRAAFLLAANALLSLRRNLAAKRAYRTAAAQRHQGSPYGKQQQKQGRREGSSSSLSAGRRRRRIPGRRGENSARSRQEGGGDIRLIVARLSCRATRAGGWASDACHAWATVEGESLW